jgi:hypothetical protein
LLYLANTAPTAANDNVTTAEDTTSALFNVLANDSDSDGSSLTFVGRTNPEHGALTAGPYPGKFTYTPAADYSGPDSFQYTISDGTDSSTATVSITVTPVNDPPVAVDDPGEGNDPVSTDEDSPVVIDVLANDSDNDTGDTLTPQIVTMPAHGTATVGAVDKQITYTPVANFNGTDSFTYVVSDGNLSSAPATVVIEVVAVNDAPVALDDAADADEGSSVTIDVLANDSDIDGDALTPVIKTPPASGTVSLADGSITYTPGPAFTGTDTFEYAASDGQAESEPATVTIEVVPVLCTGEPVTDSEGDVTGTFVLLSVAPECKRYELDADADATGSVLFLPIGEAENLTYRGFVTLEPEAAIGDDGTLTLQLQYDPEGGVEFQPVLWCIDPLFDDDGLVTTAGMPDGESWCIAGESTQAAPGGMVVTTWQVFGIDDPRFQ